MNDDFDHQILEPQKAFRKRALNLSRCHPGLKAGLGIDQIAHRLGLCEVDAPVEERSKGELSRLGQPGSTLKNQFEQPADDDGAAVAAELDNVLSCVRVWRLEAGVNGFID